MVFVSGETPIGMTRFLVFSLVCQHFLPLCPFPSWDEFLSPIVGSFSEPVTILLMFLILVP